MPSKKQAVRRKPLPDYSISRTQLPIPPHLVSGRSDNDYHPSHHGHHSLSPRASHPQSKNEAGSPETSLQEYRRQQGGQQDLEDEAPTDNIPQELEGGLPVSMTAHSIPNAYLEHSIQASSPVLIVPHPSLPQSYSTKDTDTGTAYYPAAQALPISRLLSPTSVSASYDLLGVPVITSNNPAGRAKEVIRQRYMQEFGVMTRVGEELIRRLVELDIEREIRRFERLVCSDASDEEFDGVCRVVDAWGRDSGDSLCIHLINGKKKGQASNNSASTSTVSQDIATALGGVIIHHASPSPPPRNRRISNVVSEFARYFGNETKVENWQKLCRDVGVFDELPSINKCKQALVPIWVNIHDLIYAVRNNNIPRRFASEHDLAVYTRKHKRYYPKQKAKHGGPVRALLAHIF